MTRKTSHHFTRAALASAAILCLHGMSAHAAEWQLGDGIKAKLSSTVTLGTAVRTEAPDPSVLGRLAVDRVGGGAYQLAGNSGGNDLNFRKNRPVSTVAKGLFDLEVTKGDVGLFVRARAWTDEELEHGSRAYGNIPNGFAQNAPLSDQGFDPRAKFTNAVIDDFNLFGKTKLETANLDWRMGRQVVSWGQAQFIGGGINSVNPLDAAAAARPGALPQETRIPVGMLQGKLDLSSTTNIEGWAQYEFRPTVLNGCGTFFAGINYAPPGCGFVNVLGGVNWNDPMALSNGAYPKRAADQMASNSGQFGISLAHQLKAIGTELKGFAMNYHSRTPFVRAINANLPGYGTFAPTPNPATSVLGRLTDPEGLKYGLTYAENIHLLGGSFSTALSPAARVYGEVAYRPNQPIQLNAADLIQAFVQRSGAVATNKQTNSLPIGASFDGYDRFKVTTLNLGGNQVFQNLAGASRVVASAEIGLSHVAGLPDLTKLRYGRSDDYGAAPVGGAVCTATQLAAAGGEKRCALDGFVTANSWGYRLRVAATYPGAFMGATLTPSVLFGHDVSGYSHDGVFQEGRKTLRPALRADFGKQYFADLVYTRFQGGKYFTQVDRDTVALSAGLRF